MRLMFHRSALEWESLKHNHFSWKSPHCIAIKTINLLHILVCRYKFGITEFS